MLMTPNAIRTFNAEAVRRALRESPVLLFGAGKLGSQILNLLRTNGIAVTAFLDNRRAGETHDGVIVIGPAEASLRYGSSAVFVTTSWRPATSGGMSEMRRQLLDLGCETVIPFPWILWAFQGADFYLWEHPSKMEAERDHIAAAAELFHDGRSRDMFRSLVAFRETANAELLPPTAPLPQYFESFLEPAESECFVDCGAYTGDTLQDLAVWNPDFAKAIAFEADPQNSHKLAAYVHEAGLAARVDCRPFAVSATGGTLRFAANGEASAALSAHGEIDVRAVTLDEQLRGETPTFIKMDIEGAEIEALEGARETIRKCQPVLAICVYHRQNDLWRIPLLMRSLMPGSALLLRNYMVDGLDTVCYAVPRGRLRS